MADSFAMGDVMRCLTGAAGLAAAFLLASIAVAHAAPGGLRQDAGTAQTQGNGTGYGANTPVFGYRAFKVKATASFTSEYVFRGEQRAKHSAQGGLEISTGGFYAGGWAVIPAKDRFDAYQTEIDLYGGYGVDLSETLYADIGVNGYIYNGPQLLFANRDSVEVYGGLSLSGPFKPSLYGFYDFRTRAATIEGALEYSLPFGRTDLVSSATGGYTDGRGFSYGYFQTDAELVYNFNRRASLGLGGHWAISEDRRFLKGLSLSQNNSTWYGITLKARN